MQSEKNAEISRFALPEIAHDIARQPLREGEQLAPVVAERIGQVADFLRVGRRQQAVFQLGDIGIMYVGPLGQLPNGQAGFEP